MAPEKITKQVITIIKTFCRDNKISPPDHHDINSHTRFKDLVGDLLPLLLTTLSNQLSVELVSADVAEITTLRGLVNVIINKRRGDER